MTPIWITTSVNLINDRALGIEFDSTFSSYNRAFKALPDAGPIPFGFLKQVYVMFVFDPENQVFPAPKFLKRRKEVEADVFVGREEFRKLDSAGRRRLLHVRLLDTLTAIRRELNGKVEHELDALIAAVIALEPSVSPSTVIPGEKAASELISEKPLSIKQKPSEAETVEEFQLVLQFPESAFDDESDMFAFEECLEEFLSDKANVDGNDVGLGKFNVFILTPDPVKIFKLVRPFLDRVKMLNTVRVAYTLNGEDDYHVLWPQNDPGPFEL